MKIKLFFILGCIFASHLMIAQNSTEQIIFLDSLGTRTTEGNHISYRIVEDFASTKNEYIIREYYKSGKLLMEGHSVDSDGFMETGVIKHYYESGNMKSSTTYEQAVPLGDYSSWHENGNKKEEGEYLKSPDDAKKTGLLRIDSYWTNDNKQTVINGNGNYEEMDKKYYASGALKEGFKNGVWTGKDDEIKSIFTESYVNGKLISGISTDSNQIQRNYSEVNVKPDFKGGLMAFYKYIANNFRAPEEDNLKGKIFTTFIINPDGKVSDIKIIRDIGYGTGEEALRVISASPDWIPGLSRGIPVRTRYSLPITIQSRS